MGTHELEDFALIPSLVDDLAQFRKQQLFVHTKPRGPLTPQARLIEEPVADIEKYGTNDHDQPIGVADR